MHSFSISARYCISSQLLCDPGLPCLMLDDMRAGMSMPVFRIQYRCPHMCARRVQATNIEIS